MRHQSTLHPLIAALPDDPDVLIHDLALDAGNALIVQHPPNAPDQAAFLDNRILTQQSKGHWFPIDELAELAAPLMTDAAPAMIFHVGHCGSTLIAKTLADATGVRSLREPLPLRAFASLKADSDDGLTLISQGQAQAFLSLCLKSFAKRRGAVIKATSICGDVAGWAMAAGVTRSLFVWIPLESYLAAMLDGEGSIADVRGSAPLRLRRLRRLIGEEIGDLAHMSPGTMTALCWLCETATRLTHAPDGPTLNFEDYLQDPASALSDAASALQLLTDDARIAATLEGPLMRQYAKAPERQFSAADRTAVLNANRHRLADAIAEGLAFADDLSKRHAIIGDALNAFA